MNRNLSNIIRFFLDECLPPIIRDNKYFMMPFFYLAYRGRNINRVMDFKKEVYGFSEEEYKNFYANLNSISRNRATDLNKASIDFIAQHINADMQNIIDIGCGAGYLVQYLQKMYPEKNFSACDIVDKVNTPFSYIQSDIQKLTLKSNAYDLVTCCHTLEHIIKLKSAVAELMRICRHTLVIIVPKQRYYYYTLDEHVNFFYCAYQLSALMGIAPEKIKKCENLGGDWALLVDCSSK